MEIPVGWYLVTSGSIQAGDKYWGPIGFDKSDDVYSYEMAWLPVTVNDMRPVNNFQAVIRKGDRE